jgi:hypothetical protein
MGPGKVLAGPQAMLSLAPVAPPPAAPPLALLPAAGVTAAPPALLAGVPAAAAAVVPAVAPVVALVPAVDTGGTVLDEPAADVLVPPVVEPGAGSLLLPQAPVAAASSQVVPANHPRNCCFMKTTFTVCVYESWAHAQWTHAASALLITAVSATARRRDLLPL